MTIMCLPITVSYKIVLNNFLSHYYFEFRTFSNVCYQISIDCFYFNISLLRGFPFICSWNWDKLELTYIPRCKTHWSLHLHLVILNFLISLLHFFLLHFHSSIILFIVNLVKISIKSLNVIKILLSQLFLSFIYWNNQVFLLLTISIYLKL
jgi:hypothetical protein